MSFAVHVAENRYNHMMLRRTLRGVGAARLMAVLRRAQMVQHLAHAEGKGWNLMAAEVEWIVTAACHAPNMN